MYFRCAGEPALLGCVLFFSCCCWWCVCSLSLFLVTSAAVALVGAGSPHGVVPVADLRASVLALVNVLSSGHIGVLLAVIGKGDGA